MSTGWRCDFLDATIVGSWPPSKPSELEIVTKFNIESFYLQRYRLTDSGLRLLRVVDGSGLVSEHPSRVGMSLLQEDAAVSGVRKPK